MYRRHGTAVVLPEPLEVISEAAHAAANAIQALYRHRAIAAPVGESGMDSHDTHPHKRRFVGPSRS